MVSSQKRKAFHKKTEVAPGFQPWGGSPVSLWGRMSFLGSWCHSGAIPAPSSCHYPWASSKRNLSCGCGSVPAVPGRWGSSSCCLLDSQKPLVPRLSAAGCGFLGEGQGTPGVLPEGHAQPRLWGHAAGGEAVILGLELELAVAAGQRLVRLALCLGH